MHGSGKQQIPPSCALRNDENIDACATRNPRLSTDEGPPLDNGLPWESVARRSECYGLVTTLIVWIHAPNGRKVSSVNRTLTLAAVLFLVRSIAVCQASSQASDCSTLKYLRHKVSCLCGTVQVCSGDICGRPSDYDLDDDITVELREKSGATLDSKKVVVETLEKQGTTQDGKKTSYKETERKFCFQGKRDGDYLLAFVLHKDGVSQPAIIFPTNYSHKRSKACNSIYMVEPLCPR